MMDEGITVERVTVRVALSENDRRMGILRDATRTAKDYASHRFGWAEVRRVDVHAVVDGFALLSLEEEEGGRDD